MKWKMHTSVVHTVRGNCHYHLYAVKDNKCKYSSAWYIVIALFVFFWFLFITVINVYQCLNCSNMHPWTVLLCVLTQKANYQMHWRWGTWWAFRWHVDSCVKTNGLLIIDFNTNHNLRMLEKVIWKLLLTWK